MKANKKFDNKKFLTETDEFSDERKGGKAVDPLKL
jgi:phosphatidate cytidylyltransferase